MTDGRSSELQAMKHLLYILKSASQEDTAESILKEIVDEYDAFKALIGPFMDDEGCYRDAKVSPQDMYYLDAKIDKARAFLNKRTGSNNEDKEEN